jgi:hypothetical protein
MALVRASIGAARRLEVDFDRDADVLYVSRGNPVPSYAGEAPDGILLRWADDDSRPTGVTAIDFCGNWSGRLPEFYAVVAAHLRVPERTVARAMESVLSGSAARQ